MDAVFEADGDLLSPTGLARGPWDPGALHGGPTAGAVVRAAETLLAGNEHGPWAIARMTLDLLRPVPVRPLRVAARVTRPGRKVTLVEVTVTAGSEDDLVVARAVVLAIGRRPVELPGRPAGRGGPDGPDGPATAPAEGLPTASPPVGAGGWRAFHNEAVEMRWAAGTWRQPGPATVWMRLRVPLVAGEDVSPAARAASLADFGNGISSELDWTAWRFINPELTVHLARMPVGDWICLDARTITGDDGAAVATSDLSDRSGLFGRSAESLLIEPAGG